MRDFTTLQLPQNDKDWLIVGKGPSFDNLSQYDLDEFNVLALNHTASKIPKNEMWVVMMDFDVFTAVYSPATAIYRAHLMPYFPHIDFKPAGNTYYLEDNAINLYRFAATTYKGNQPNPKIKVQFNVAEAAFGILCQLGVKKIYTIGVNGGTVYAKAFRHMKPLTNGRADFNDQFRNIFEVIHANKVDWIQL